MKIHRSVTEPIRPEMSWEQRWGDTDQGLIFCWERGRVKQLEDPIIASHAREGRLIPLPSWKGGVRVKLLETPGLFSATIKVAENLGRRNGSRQDPFIGSLNYLAMWQGLRGDDLNVNTDEEVLLICSETGMAVLFTADLKKLGEEEEEAAEEKTPELFPVASK